MHAQIKYFLEDVDFRHVEFRTGHRMHACRDCPARHTAHLVVHSDMAIRPGHREARSIIVQLLDHEGYQSHVTPPALA